MTISGNYNTIGIGSSNCSILDSTDSTIESGNHHVHLINCQNVIVGDLNGQQLILSGVSDRHYYLNEALGLVKWVEIDKTVSDSELQQLADDLNGKN